MLSKIKEHYQHGGILEILKYVGIKVEYLLYLKPKEERERKKKEREDLIYNGPFNTRGIYHTYRVMRCLERCGSKIISFPWIIRNHRARIAVVLHFYYNRSIEEVIQYLKNIKSSYKFDLYITMPKDINYDYEIRRFLQFKKDAKIIRCDNNGYDIGPFMDILNQIDLDNYDVLIKLQTKSTNKSIYVYNQFFKNRDWFNDLWKGVIGPLSIHTTIRKIYRDRNVGIVAAKNLIIHDPKHKQELVKETLSNYGKINYIDDYYFVAGSCFAIKTKCLKSIQRLKLSTKVFERTEYGFFSLAHVVERAICFSIMPEYKFYGTHVDYWRRLKWSRLERRLYVRSMLRIAENPKYSISPDFVWMVLEMRFMNKYKEEKMSIDRIRREYFDGKIMNLEECEPYRYLCGDVDTYKKYTKYQKEHKLPFMSISRFESLIGSIKKNGYMDKYPIIVDDKNIVWDGQHRACILLKEFGKDYRVNVLKVYPQIIELADAKPFSCKINGIII